MKSYLGIILLVAVMGCTKNNSSLTKEQEVRQLLIDNGASDRILSTHRQYIESGKVKYPNVPPESWKRLDAEVQEICEELLQVNIRLYSDFFTQDEIKELHTFYSSPVGKKFFSNMTRLQNDSAQQNLALAQKFESAYLRTLKEAGYDTKSIAGK